VRPARRRRHQDIFLSIGASDRSCREQPRAEDKGSLHPGLDPCPSCFPKEWNSLLGNVAVPLATLSFDTRPSEHVGAG
jgi:hypothetical protein